MKEGMGYKEHLLVEKVEKVVWSFKSHVLLLDDVRVKVSGRRVVRWFREARKHAGQYTAGLWYRVYADKPEEMAIVGQTIRCHWE